MAPVGLYEWMHAVRGMGGLGLCFHAAEDTNHQPSPPGIDPVFMEDSVKKVFKNKPIGTAPGTLLYTGEKRLDEPILSCIDYGSAHHRVEILSDPQGCRELMARDSVSWINLTGLHQVELVRQLGDIFNINDLVLEDILNTQHLPKFEDCDDAVLFIFPLFHRDAETRRITSEQISMLIGPTWLLTFQEVPEDVFDQLRQRLQRTNGRIRQRGTDYLGYAILDTVVDSYLHLIAHLEEDLELLEETVFAHPVADDLQKIHGHKREVLMLRRSLRPLQIAVGEFCQLDSELLNDETQPFLRDLTDHLNRAVEAVDALRDANASLLELYLSLANQKLNETMKVLTIMASLFIPLTFIAGIYGMNFEFMPELKWAWGYPMLWLVFLLVASGMLWFFKRKKWF
jgi:magnesium transporter